jgi:cytochrome c-type biogenesis protein CcsB
MATLWCGPRCWFNGKSVFTGGGMIADVKPQHRLSPRNPTFGGNILVAEGGQGSVAILQQSDGVLLQELPFSIELKKFIVEYYSTGMPKLFASDIMLHDRETGAKGARRVSRSTTRPATAAWRSTSRASTTAAPRSSSRQSRCRPRPSPSRSTASSAAPNCTKLGRRTRKADARIHALRVINVENFADGGAMGSSGADVRKVDLRHHRIALLGAANKTSHQKELRNVGPSIGYKLRDSAGQAREFTTTWCRSTPANGQPGVPARHAREARRAFRYLRMPADEQGTMDSFVRMRTSLADAATRTRAVERYIARAVDPKRPEMAEQLSVSAARALALFAGSERAKAGRHAGRLAGDCRIHGSQRARGRARTRGCEVLVRILNDVLFEVLNLSREGAGMAALPNDEKIAGLSHPGGAGLSDAHFYPAPVAMMMTDFTQVQASVFQVARAPGKNVVYLGCAVADRRDFCHAVRARAPALGVADTRERGPRRQHHHGRHDGFLGQSQDDRQRPRVRAPQAQTACLEKRRTGVTMNTTTLTLHESWFSRRNLFDWVFAALVLAGGLFAFARHAGSMDSYEKGILAAAMMSIIAIGWFWRPLRVLAIVVAAASLLAISSYQGDLARADTVFWLKYFLSSQSAILWMSVLFFMSTLFYWLGFFGGKQGDTFDLIASRLAWVAIAMALIGTMVRWYESHLLGPDIGHIPVSNLYEVFVLFCWLTTAFYLYFESRYGTRTLGAFVMLVVSAAVGFLLWYTLVRNAHEIQPLVPALQSWWMKLHVPANFIGYGTFALAAMVAFAYLIKEQASETRWYKLTPIWLLGVALCFVPVAFRQRVQEAGGSYWVIYAGISALIAAGILLGRKRIAARLPANEVLDDVMYKSITVGFAFFTIATVLGALWAADAWGGYWSWDPKETWALIVWLNYAAWLHMRLVKGLRGTVAAWWALVGLAVTTFAFLGVNMFLSGLHSYGTL